MELEGNARVNSGDRILTIPNVLSLLRLATVPIFVWLFLNDHANAAVILYIVSACSDFFDGFIARRFDQVSELGKLLDPLADRVFIVALAVALVGEGALPLWLAIVIIGRDILILAAFPLLERKKVARIAVNFVGKSATAALLAGLTCLALSETTLPGNGVGEAVGLAFTITGAVLYWVAATIYAKEAIGKLHELEGGVHA